MSRWKDRFAPSSYQVISESVLLAPQTGCALEPQHVATLAAVEELDLKADGVPLAIPTEEVAKQPVEESAETSQTSIANDCDAGHYLVNGKAVVEEQKSNGNLRS